MVEVTQEGTYIRWENEVPTHVILKNAKLRIPVVLKVAPASDEEIAELFV